MLRSLPAAVAATGVVAATTLCCSDTSAPTRAAAPRTALVASSAASAPTLTPQQSGTTNRLQAISPVSPRVAWASGVGGTYVVTTDGGATWRAGVVPGAEGLQFRDVEGVSETDAYLMSAGSGTASRIYKTEDGGVSWSLQFQNQDPDAFYDCFAFWSPKHGLTMSDAVNGRFPVIRTLDGVTWQDIGDRLPVAQSGEAAFAASGTCITAQGGKRAWIATRAAAQAPRALHRGGFRLELRTRPRPDDGRGHGAGRRGLVPRRRGHVVQPPRGRELLGGGIREPPGGVAGGYAGPDLEGQLLSLELALLHLREEVAPFQVLVGRVGREGRVVLTLHLPLGLRRLGGGFPHQGGQLLVVAF